MYPLLFGGYDNRVDKTLFGCRHHLLLQNIDMRPLSKKPEKNSHKGTIFSRLKKWQTSKVSAYSSIQIIRTNIK
jgi:hypothetical protein